MVQTHKLNTLNMYIRIKATSVLLMQSHTVKINFVYYIVRVAVVTFKKLLVSYILLLRKVICYVSYLRSYFKSSIRIMKLPQLCV